MLTGCGGTGATEHTNAAIPVVTKKMAKENIARVISVSGNIEGQKTARLGFMVAGKVNYIAAKEGATIEVGQLLASLDPESYRIAKEMADANLEQAQDEYNRLSIMHERKSIAASDYAKISSVLKLAKAQQKLQSKNLADTKLYSPFRGVLLKRGIEVGEIIGAGLPLFAVSDIDIVRVNASIPETDLQLIKMGSEARVYVSSIDSTYTGKVVEIGSLAEPTTRAFSVKIELKNPNLAMRPGMTAEIKIMSGRKTEILAVPVEAVLRDLDNTAYVFAVDEVKKQAFKRKISLGQINENSITVTAGLAPEEMVVVGGQHKLNDGSSIVLK
ncbi:MAG: efflux RND transporter periplasmic adaptor subunit [Deltaproteobacteria bacterium HGW-Deltaproteobacteria-10]|nr:MAG: efflux RND transporter periplasmic adaptor subunit [Deltaproteobacteria bacterium HGW-Deltaproteobacteria-10]